MEQENKDNEGADLSGALKDSGARVIFEEYAAPRSYYPETSKVVRWMITYSGGMIRDKERANYVLLGLAIVIIIITLSLFASSGPKGKSFEEQFPPGSSALRE